MATIIFLIASTITYLLIAGECRLFQAAWHLVGRNSSRFEKHRQAKLDNINETAIITVQLCAPHRFPYWAYLDGTPALPLSHFNVFNFPQHFRVLKYRLIVVEKKKSVSDF